MLRVLRKKKGVTMKELGDEVGVAESTISQYETGKRSPDFETLLRFGEYFNVSVDYLLGKTSFKNSKDLFEQWGVNSNPDFEAVFDFGEILKEERENQGISQKEMSEALGITENDLEDCEAGILPLNYNWAEKMAKFLGTNVSQLMFDSGLYDEQVPEEYHDDIRAWEKAVKKADEEVQREHMIGYRATLTPDELDGLSKYRTLLPEEQGAVQAIFDYVCKVHEERAAQGASNIIELPLFRAAGSQDQKEIVEIFRPYQAFGAGSQDDIGDRNGEPVRVLLTSTIRKADYVVNVIGDSMEPAYPDGCMVAIMRTQDVGVGDIGAFVLDGEHIVKKVGERAFLSLNPAYGPIELTEHMEITILGKVLGVVEEE